MIESSSFHAAPRDESSYPFLVGSLAPAQTLPLVIRPRSHAERGPGELVRFLASERRTVSGWLRLHGAILFRGFRITTPEAFESLALAIDPTLGTEHLGTSPRDPITRHVFTASELPGFYPIPQHLEMSFLPSAPSRLFFAALRPNAGVGGETPLADFRAVLRDLDPAVRERFVSKGVRNVRNYAGPSQSARLDPWKLKRWDEMFGTTDRAAVELRARAEGLTPIWKGRDTLALVNVQPAVRAHPETGEPVWHNHSQVFHASAAAGELRRIARVQRPLRTRALARLADTLVRVKRRLGSEEDLAMHCTYGDGTPIPDADMEAVRDAIWKNLVVYRWRRGDVAVVDNRAVSHGRLPYRGDRLVAVAWAPT